REVTRGIVDYVIRARINDVSRATVRVREDALRDVPVDYMGRARLFDSDGVEVHSGYVISAHLEGAEFVITLVTSTELFEVILKSMVSIQVTPSEIVWSALRIAGLDEERLNIEGLPTGPTEVIE